MEVRLEASSKLIEYAKIPISFTVDSVYDIVPIKEGLGGLSLVERQVEPPYLKDYDVEENGGPTNWPRRFDIRDWAIIMAYEEGRLIGGATLAWRSGVQDLLQARDDLAFLWDLRVNPEWRSKKIASKLLSVAKDWAKSRKCIEIRTETQNINVPACRFYAAQGFTLFSIDPAAYPDLPNETQLIWRRKI